MEKIGEDLRSEKIKSQTAIRCAKAALLLSSIKNATNFSPTDVPQLQDEEKIEKLRVELVKERMKLKKFRHLICIILIFHFIIVLLYPLFLNSL